MGLFRRQAGWPTGNGIRVAAGRLVDRVSQIGGTKAEVYLTATVMAGRRSGSRQHHKPRRAGSGGGARLVPIARTAAAVAEYATAKS